jgi:hypothetical protein
MTLQSRIAVAVEDLRMRGGHPARVCLTPENAARLQYELINQGGHLAHQIMQSGVRHVVPTIFGLEIVWHCERFEVV